MVRAKTCPVNISENAGLSRIRRTVADFSMRIIEDSVIVLTVPIRRDCPARFAKEIVRTKNCNDRFLTLRGNDRDLDLAFLNVEHGIRGLVLREDNVVLLVLNDAPTLASFGEKGF